MKLRPELLQHPNIPKPMHGLNPRTLLGKDWWDTTRFRVQKEQGYVCAACGTEKRNAWPNAWLECHEDYTIDYANGRIEINDFVALCPACHKFIHSGRLVVDDEISWETKKAVMEHGWRILSAEKMYHSMATAIQIDAEVLWMPMDWIEPSVANRRGWQMPPDYNVESFAEWSDWRMILDGKEHKPLHPTMAAWKRHYAR